MVPFVVFLVTAGWLCPGCTGSKSPAPTRIDADNKKVVGQTPQPTNKPKGPFRHPDRQPPPPRSGEQLAPQALEQALASAREQVASGETFKALATLRTCANKVPADLRCEAEIGIILADLARHRADARYYLSEAAKLDDPKADAELFRRLGAAMKKHGLHQMTGDVYQRMIDHGAGSAADYELLSKGLQADATRLREAADALAKARSLDPSNDKWVYEEGLLRAQVAGQSTEAADLLSQYLAKTRGQDPELDNVLEARIAELSGLGKIEKTAKPDNPGDVKKPPPLVQ